jgi:signal transduction histidine kinase
MAIDDLPLGSEPSKPLIEAMRAALKAADISRKMLTYLGQVTGMKAPVDLSEACRQSLPHFEAIIPQSLTLTADLPSPGPIIRANADQIQQVITILVTNGWEACGEKQGTMALTVKTVSPAELFVAHRFPLGWQAENIPYACLEVQDTGCGIAEEDIDKLFDPFFSSKHPGRGLGLPVVLGIVKAHHGAIAVESTMGRGSTFRVFFPLPPEDLDELANAGAVPDAPPAPTGSSINLLHNWSFPKVLLLEPQSFQTLNLS